jgi:HEAT repeat protein
MELNEIKSFLENPNPQNRMKAIVELRNYEPSVVVPLLKQRMYDQEFIVRSFVAMGLGYKRTEEAYQSLLDIIENDRDPNVKAEAANSLSKYGEKAIPHLVELFKKDSHWLIRQSIFAVINELDSMELLWELSCYGVQGDDIMVKLTSITNLSRLKNTVYEEQGVNLLFDLCTDKLPIIRIRLAKVLALFEHPKAKTALAELRNDSDHRVVAATLESLIV